MLRFRLYPASRGPCKSIAEAFSDCFDCARHSDNGALGKVGLLFTGIPYELATEATPRKRLAFFSLLVLMLVATGVALTRGVSLERRRNAEVDRIAGLEALLAQTERAVYTRGDFEAARSEIDALIGGVAVLCGAPKPSHFDEAIRNSFLSGSSKLAK